MPANGLAIFTGLVAGRSTKKKEKIAISYEPDQPLRTNLYWCGKQFRLDPLKALVESSVKGAVEGFVILSGKKVLIGKLKRDVGWYSILKTYTVDLPNNHKRGGFSANRMARLRDEAIHNYLRKVSEFSAKAFLLRDSVLVSSISFAGPGDLKQILLNRTSLFDPRLQAIVSDVVDTANGGTRGLQQLIKKLSASAPAQYPQLQEFYDSLSKGDLTTCVGPRECWYAWQNNLIKCLILHEDVRDPRFSKLVRHRKYSAEAAKGGCEVVLVRCPQFRDAYGGVAGLLHFALDLSVQTCDESEKGKRKDEPGDTAVIKNQPKQTQAVVVAKRKLVWTGYEFKPGNA
eukprot:TRINITY_DN5204_c0_g1_i1.p1 TRINITY_DN5204_c0_g1~~TRINITY_DN5204_c0_g1_i1.p1  ORF type:complete len:344 (-),score=44.76 TRINITY_DN5204_c0_g1_i1:33-1064(-)